MKSVLRFCKYNRYPLMLIAVGTLICVTNYVPGTFLTGWDTLHPEFDFLLNFKRVFFGVWRSEQGLGAVAIHSHMVELPRILFLWLASIVVPVSFLRYLYVFVCLILGPLGVYVFIKQGVLDSADQGNKIHRTHAGAAFVGALFYLLNIGTVQQFYVPFEMFTTLFGALGWLLWLATQYWYKPTKKRLFWFALVTLLASPMAYAATLFYAYFLAFIVYLACMMFQKQQQANIKKATILVLTTLIINSYWLLPNLYAITFHSQEVQDSRINSFFSQEAYLHNKAYGTLPDVALLKGFLFSWSEYVGNGNFDYLLNEWRAYTDQPAIIILEYSLFALAVVGFVLSFRKRQIATTGLIGITLLCLVFLMNANPPFSLVFDTLRDHIPLFKEALRTPYTKFSIILALCYAVFIALALQSLQHKIHIPRLSIKVPFLVLAVSLAIGVSMAPVFAGKMISPSMKVAIPSEYFSLYTWMNQQDHGKRVAVLPAPAFWGWNYYDWGYQGAGFLWFGMPQPLLDRDFDRWSTVNEQEYKELSYAVYAQDDVLFDKLLKKYQIGYVLFDQHIIVPEAGVDDRPRYIPEIKDLLKNSQRLHLAKSFSKDLALYEVQPQTQEQAVVVTPESKNVPVDQAYQDHGTYFFSESRADSDQIDHFQYLFRDFLGQNNIVGADRIAINSSTYTVKALGPYTLTKLPTPSYTANEPFIAADLYAQKQGNTMTFKIIYGLPWPEGSGVSPRPASILQVSVPSTSSGQAFVVAINQAQPLTLPQTDSVALQRLGRVMLTTNRNNTIAVFPEQTTQVVPLALQSATLDPERCSDAGKDQLFGIDPEANGGVVLSSKNVIACFKTPLPPTIQALTAATQIPVLMQLSFSYEATNDAIPYYCVFDTVAERCLYTSYGNGVSHVTAADTFVDTVALTKGMLTRNSLRFFLDAVNASQEKRLTIRDASLAFFNPIASTELTPAAIQGALNEQQFVLPKVKELQLTGFMPGPNRSVLSDITRIRRDIDTCSNLVPKLANRQVLTQENQRFIVYQAIAGASCDHFSYPTLEHDRGYLVTVEARHVSGLPLRICVSNTYTKRCDVYTSLDYGSEFQKYVVYVPPAISPGLGFDVNVNNESIGLIPTVNHLKSITISPIPGRWLTSLQRGSSQAKGIPVATETSGHSLPFIVPIRTNLKATSSLQLIQINEAFEPGWLLLKSTNGLWGPVPAEHVKVNNWANGWLLTYAETSGNLYAVFMPQILEFTGLIAGALWLGLILIIKNHH